MMNNFYIIKKSNQFWLNLMFKITFQNYYYNNLDFITKLSYCINCQNGKQIINKHIIKADIFEKLNSIRWP